ncbi:MAG: hypothetical protein R3344_11000 [Acidobacteriota bacterium]|nr:hypothetical protein [Acidobacteriota bacterium]
MKLLARGVMSVVVVSLALAVAPSAQAACTSDRFFGTYPSEGACGNYCYVFSPGVNTVESMKGFYWVLGEGPTRNSGIYEFDGTNGSQPWFIGGGPYANGWSLFTSTNNGLTEGCPGPGAAVWLFSDLSQDGGSALWAIAAVEEDLFSGSLAFDLGLNGTINLQPLPDVSVTDVQRGGNGELIVDLSWAPNAAAAFTTSTSLVPDVNLVVTGWNVYKREVPSGAQAPTDRANDSWDMVGTVAGDAASGGQVTFSCDDPANNQVFLAVAPELDNGFTAPAYLGRNSTRVECDPNLADPGDRRDRKGFERPTKLKRR